MKRLCFRRSTQPTTYGTWYAKRSLMSWVGVIPKEWRDTDFSKKKNSPKIFFPKNGRARPSFGMTQAIRDLLRTAAHITLIHDINRHLQLILSHITTYWAHTLVSHTCHLFTLVTKVLYHDYQGNRPWLSRHLVTMTTIHTSYTWEYLVSKSLRKEVECFSLLHNEFDSKREHNQTIPVTWKYQTICP